MEKKKNYLLFQYMLTHKHSDTVNKTESKKKKSGVGMVGAAFSWASSTSRVPVDT